MSYAGSHGLRGTGGGACDEAVRVPLCARPAPIPPAPERNSPSAWTSRRCLKNAQEQGIDDDAQSTRSIAARAERLGNFLEDFLTPK
ncbi:hypothetical protein ACWDNI_02435 [Nocardia niigatensis]